jgi:hypothetical protein
MVDIQITQLNVQLYFRELILDNADKLSGAFSQSEGFNASRASDHGSSHPMQDTMSFFREGFRIAPVQSNVLPFRILQVMSYPNACLHYVAASLKRHLNVDIESDIYAVRVVYHSIVTGSHDIHRVLSKMTRIDRIPTLAGRYVGHKNPMDALQLTSMTGGELSDKFWNDIRVSQFSTNSYVVTIFNETDSLASALDFIKNVKQFVATLMQEMEAAATES